ncbi:MAG: ATP-binding protein [Candidatus Omnitrophota bacterium]
MRTKLHHKITIAFVVIIAVIFLGIYFFLNTNFKENTYQRIRTNLIKQIFLSRTYIEEKSLSQPPSFDLDQWADKIGRDLRLRATIIALDGTVYGDSQINKDKLLNAENHLYRPEVQQAVKAGFGESRRFSTTLKRDMLYLAKTYGHGRARGIIRLSVPLYEVDAVSGHLRKTMGFSFIFAFLLAIVVSFLASIFISRPLRQISGTVQDMAKGDLSGKAAVDSKDEIGDLAEAFNHMSEQIKMRMEEVITSKSRLEAVLFSMFEGVMVIDLDGRILLVNQRLKDFLRISDETSGKKPLEVIRNIEIQEIADSVLNLKKGVESRQISLLIPEEKILLVHAAPVIHQEKTEGAVLVFHDVTELKRLEQIRKDFVANVSHELRTPISSIKGYAETLLEGALDDKENAKDFLRIIYADSDRLAKLIEDILDLSKIESGRLKIDLRPIPLGPVLKRVVSGLSGPAKAKSITVSVDIPSGIPPILADETRISQVLFNLIDNALKYTNDGGQITISARAGDRSVQVDVADTGIGIPEQDWARIFERFYRVDKARSRELGGTGLGLAIVKHIIQAHNGEVFLRSVEGQGSTFSFTVPQA